MGIPILVRQYFCIESAPGYIKPEIFSMKQPCLLKMYATQNAIITKAKTIFKIYYDEVYNIICINIYINHVYMYFPTLYDFLTATIKPS